MTVWITGRQRSGSICIASMAGRRRKQRSGGCCEHRGFINPQPRKAPKHAYRRFVAERANECWQIDATKWWLADGTMIEIINVIDDCTRVLIASVAVSTCTTANSWETLCLGAQTMGMARAGAVRQRAGVPRSSGQRRTAPGAGSAGHRGQPLAPVSPANLRQGRTLPPNPQTAISPPETRQSHWPSCKPTSTGHPALQPPPPTPRYRTPIASRCLAHHTALRARQSLARHPNHHQHHRGHRQQQDQHRLPHPRQHRRRSRRTDRNHRDHRQPRSRVYQRPTHPPTNHQPQHPRPPQRSVSNVPRHP